ncbi:type II secretion system F family protein, partial [Aeromonas salmonicida]
MATLTQKQNAPKKVFAFRWSGVNRKGQKVSGELQADSINTVKAELRKQGVNVTRVSKKSQGLFSKGGARIKPMDIAIVSRQITTMLSAGVPLVQSLQIIARSHEKAAMRELMGQIAADVETGTPMSDALRRHPRHFDALYCDLVEAGEQSGALETIYDRIATYREKSEALKSKIKKAMFYPAMVILVAIVVTSILLLFVIPQFEDIFKSFGAELPIFTQFVIGISRFMQDWWYVIFGGIGLGIFLYVRAW